MNFKTKNFLKFDAQISPVLSQRVEKKILAAFKEEHSCSIREAYENIYTLVDAEDTDTCIFTSSGAEAVSHVVFASYFDSTRKQGKNHFVAAKIAEAPAMLAMSKYQEAGCIFEAAPMSRDGTVSAQTISETLTPKTALLSLSWADALTGVVQPVEEIAQICRERGVLFHLDASHVLGKGNYSFKECGADFLTINGQAIGAPKGTGALFIRSSLKESSPFIFGGRAQAAMRGGEYSLPLLAGLGEAAKEAKENSDHFCMEIARLKSIFEASALKTLPHAQVLFSESLRVPHISSLTFSSAVSDALLFLMNEQKLQATLGGGNFQHIQHVLEACGIKAPLCHTALSFGFSKDVTEEEIEKGVEILGNCVERLGAHSKKILEEAVL